MKRLFAFLFAVVAFVACEDVPPETPPETPSISIKTAQPSAFSDAGGEAVVEFVVSEDWVVEIDATRAEEWVTVEPMSGVAGNAKITITAVPNDTYDNRTATVSIKAGTIKESIAVNQSQKNGLVASAKEFEVDSQGGTIDLDVTTNVDLTVTISDDAKEWISDVSTRAMETKTLSFEIAPNVGDADRSGEIIIAGGGLVQTVVVKQGYYVVPNNQICYTSTDGKVVMPYNIYVFGVKLVSNVYEDGKGIITFDGDVTSIGDHAFFCSTSLTSIALPESVTSIGDYAFMDCTSLTSITIPDSVTSIGNNPFTSCSSLASFDGKYASTDNRCLIVDGVLKSFAPAGLTSYTIPTGVTSIGEVAFLSCNSLTSITLPNGVTSIGTDAFYGCSSLTSITLPDSVTSIGNGAFWNCSSLTSITLPDSVTSIGSNPFECCSSLASFCGKYASTDNRCLIVDGVLKSFAPAGLTSYTIPTGVTSIGEYAFYECTSMTNITLPNSVISIGYNTFTNCLSLTNITLPDSVTKIGIFAFKGCSSLATVYSKPTTPPTLGSYVFESTSLSNIYVPTSSVSAYKAGGWSSYASIIEGYTF